MLLQGPLFSLLFPHYFKDIFVCSYIFRYVVLNICGMIGLSCYESMVALALAGDDDCPYAVPISYAYSDSKLYFHGAKSGHKIDAIKRCDKASFCVIDKDDVVPEEYTTYFRSVIAFGKIRIMEEESEMRKAIELLNMQPVKGN